MSAAGIGLNYVGQMASNQMATHQNSLAIANQSVAAQKLANQQYGLQMRMFNNTGYEAQVNQMKKAGINPGILYGKGGPGGQLGAGMPSAPSGTGGNLPKNFMNIADGIALAKMAAEVENIKADTANKTATAETTEASRDTLVENMKQSGISQWFENLKTEMEREGWNKDTDIVNVFRNKVYNKQAGGYTDQSPQVQQFIADLYKTEAERNNLDANALLTNEKAKGYWQELLIATQQADANTINAKANELAKQWETGEFTNWKTWVDLAQGAVQSVGGLIKNVKSAPTPQTRPNSWMNKRP